MAADAHRVGVVLAAGFDAEVASLSRVQHVWVIRLPEYEVIAEGIAAADPELSMETGVTLFNGGAGSPEEELEDIIDTIDLHHGEASADQSFRVLDVLGAQSTPAVRAILAEYGFTDIQPSAPGFVTSRR